ncbi:MAG: tRNA (adenosine(37)-N6)-threonylcarbamoyltransferase complex dimerization subunit type 1 TsaB [Pseudomonadota bacterium]
MILLAFDTSGPFCAGALFGGSKLLEAGSEDMQRGQAERLMPMLEELLSRQGHDWSTLEALAVGTGPGNFTGLRVAVSAARGLALARGIPAVGVSAFEAWREDAPCAVALPAPRGDAYFQSFTASGPDAPRQLTQTEASAEAALRGLPLITPETALKRDGTPLVARVGRVALAKLATGAPLPRPAPLYVRAADAAPSRDAPPRILGQ